MSTYFTEDFDGTSGTTLPTYGWARVWPASLAGTVSEAALLNGHAIPNSAVAAERGYRASQFPGYTNYKFRSNIKWAAPKTSARYGGVGVRVTSSQGYWIHLDSNINDPKVRLRRYSNGSWTTLVAWKPVTTGSQGAVAESMVQGIDVQLAVRNTANGVRLVGKIGAVEVFDFTDTQSSFQINGGGSPGIWIGPYCGPTAISFQDGVALDFEEEAVEAEAVLTTGLALMVNGQWYDEQGWKALGLDVRVAETSFEAGSAGTIIDLNPFNEAVLTVGTEIAIRYNDTTISSGILRRAQHNLNPTEGSAYDIVTWKQLAQEVPIVDDYNGAGSMAFNTLDAEMVDRDPSKNFRVGGTDNRKTLGAMIEHVVDVHLEGDGNLRDLGCAPSSGTVWDTDGGVLPSAVMTSKPNNVTVSGNVISAVETLLGYYPEYALRILPDTKKWRIKQRSTASLREIDLAASHVIGELIEDTSQNYTAVMFRGTRPESETKTVGYQQGGLNKRWNSLLEGAHTPDKQWKSGNETTIIANGTDSGRVYIDVASTGFSMSAGEWTKARLVIHAPDPAAGSYTIYSNTTGRFVVDRESWIGGGTPSNGSKVTVGVGEGQDQQNNTFNEMFKAFELPDGAGFLNGGCIKARVTTGSPDGGLIVWETSVKVQNPTDGGAATAILSTPAVQPLQLTGFSSGGGLCDTAGNVEMADDIEIQAPIIPDLSEPTVPTKRVPEVGFRGTAYSDDQNKWDGGGYPNLGDAKVRRVLTLDDSGYEGALEDAEYEALADAILTVYGTKGRQARITLAGIDLTWVDIESRVQIKHTGGRTTGWESLTDLWQIGVSYDFAAQTTTIWCGTLSSMGRFDIAKQRQLYTESTQYDFLRAQAASLQQLLDCLQQSFAGGAVAGPGNPNPICSEQVASPGGLGGGSVSGALDALDCEPLATCEEENFVDTEDIGVNTCTTTQCGIINDATVFEQNAAHLDTLLAIIAEPYPTGYDPSPLADALQAAAILKNYMMVVLREFGSIMTSIDNELGVGANDLQGLKTALDTFRDCVNAQLATLCTTIQAVDLRLSGAIQCFNLALAGKVDGPGTAGSCTDDPVDCEIEVCDLDWTPLLCETPCVQVLTNLALDMPTIPEMYTA